MRTNRWETRRRSPTRLPARSTSSRLWSWPKWRPSPGFHRCVGPPPSQTPADRSLCQIGHLSVSRYRSISRPQWERRRSSAPATSQIQRSATVTIWRSLHDPTIPKNPHGSWFNVTHPNAFYRSIARGLLDQVGVFFASGGTVVIHARTRTLLRGPDSNAASGGPELHPLVGKDDVSASRRTAMRAEAGLTRAMG